MAFGHSKGRLPPVHACGGLLQFPGPRWGHSGLVVEVLYVAAPWRMHGHKSLLHITHQGAPCRGFHASPADAYRTFSLLCRFPIWACSSSCSAVCVTPTAAVTRVVWVAHALCSLILPVEVHQRVWHFHISACGMLAPCAPAA